MQKEELKLKFTLNFASIIDQHRGTFGDPFFAFVTAPEKG